jgi:CRP-like cAMP-binding protein
MEYGRPERNHLLSLLPPEDLARLERHLRFTQLDAGGTLYEANTPIEQVYFPLDGVISLLTNFNSGHVVDFAVVGSEGMVGDMVAYGIPRVPYSAIVQVAGSAFAAKTSAFLELLNESPASREIVGKFQATLLLQAQQIAACNAVHSVEARMCRWLLQIRNRTQSNVLPVTQEFLSHMLGVQRTTVTLVEQTLKAAGLVRQRRGRIELLDEAGLRARACECYEHIRRDYREVLPRLDHDDAPLAPEHVPANRVMVA